MDIIILSCLMGIVKDFCNRMFKALHALKVYKCQVLLLLAISQTVIIGNIRKCEHSGMPLGVCQADPNFMLGK